MLEDVILVNGADEKTGLKDKTQTHIGGDLHRAFTTVIYRINHRTGKLEVLAAQRAEEKETWGGFGTAPIVAISVMERLVRRHLKERWLKSLISKAG